MNDNVLSAMERAFKKCSDCLLHPDYIANLKKLGDIDLTQELIDYLCDKTTSKKHIWEIRLEHLRILLLNPSAKAFDLKDFYFENLKKCRRLAMKIFFIRGYAIYASEAELNPVMDNFRRNLEKNHDYIDYNDILSVAGLPYLVDVYGYDCFCKAYQKAQEEVQRISPLLLGGFTRDSRLRQVILRSPAETMRREKEFLASLKKNP